MDRRQQKAVAENLRRSAERAFLDQSSTQVNVDDLTDWMGGEDRWETYASIPDKKFEVYRRRGIYRVTVNGDIRYLGPRKEAAIRVYNGEAIAKL
jgi:hypothetical protein